MTRDSLQAALEAASGRAAPFGASGLDIAGLTPSLQPAPTIATAEASELPGEEVHFVALTDGTLVVEEDVPDGSLTPLAESLERLFEPPYRAVGLRADGPVWSVAGERVAIVALPEAGELGQIELTSLDGETRTTADGEETASRFPELERLGAERGDDYVVRAERIEPGTWVVDVDPL